MPIDVAVVGNYAYVADDYGGLKIIDISSKTNPTLVGSIATSDAFGVAVVGNYAYVADTDRRVKNFFRQQGSIIRNARTRQSR